MQLIPADHDRGEWRWLAEQLLERAYWELARADEKANTLFRLYGVVLAAGVAFSVSGGSSSLHHAAAALLLSAAICALIAGALLATALAPRHHRKANTSAAMPGYFGDVNRFPDSATFAAALDATSVDVEAWIVEQIRVVSRIVEHRYRLMRVATALTWGGIALTVVAAVAQRY